MKEIIEYLLAALVIISFIPVYAVINQTLYTPPPKGVSPLVLSTYTEVVKNTLFELGKEQVVDPYVIDLGEFIAEKIPEVYNTFGFHIDSTSWLVKNVTVNNNIVTVYVFEPGNLSLLIIYDDLSYDSIKLLTYTSKTNSLYIYQYTASSPNIIAISAILETGVATCIGYWISNNVYKAYMVSNDGVLSLVIPTDEPAPSTTYYNGIGYVVYAHVYYYNYGSYYKYSNLYYTYIKDVYWYSYYRIVLNFNKSRIVYYGVDQGVEEINGKTYYRFDLINHYYDQLYRKTCYRQYDNVWSCWGERTLSPAYIVNTPISFPIYNTVFIILKDSSGRLYVAQTYYNSFSFGDSIPENWPIQSISYVVRIGMIDYEVKVTVWRRSI